MPRPLRTSSVTKSSNAVISKVSSAISSARCAGIFTAVHHQDRAHRAVLDRLALRMRTVAKHLQLVEVFARRHVAQRKGLAHQGRLVGAQRMHILNALDAEAALVERGRDRRGGDGLELGAGGVAEL